MPTKCCWVIHGSLTSERKASTSPSSFINHSTLLLNRALKASSAKLLVFTCTIRSSSARQAQSQNASTYALGLRAVEVIICMITRDFSVISMTSQASLSLFLSLTKVTDAQCRKRFRASYNNLGVWLKTKIRGQRRKHTFAHPTRTHSADDFLSVVLDLSCSHRQNTNSQSKNLASWLTCQYTKHKWGKIAQARYKKQ